MALAAAGAECASAAPDAATTCRPGPEPGHYRVEVKIVSVPSNAAKEISSDVYNAYYSDAILGHLLSSPQTTIVSCPVVEALSALPATIAITRDVTLSSKSREVGINFSVTPDSKAEPGSRYQLAYSNVRFSGFADAKATLPVFNTQRLSTTMVVFHPPSQGYCCFNLRTDDHTVATYDANGRRSASIADANERQLLFVKITRG
jgi:hypothetical protein